VNYAAKGKTNTKPLQAVPFSGLCVHLASVHHSHLSGFCRGQTARLREDVATAAEGSYPKLQLHNVECVEAHMATADLPTGYRQDNIQSVDLAASDWHLNIQHVIIQVENLYKS
jgi:hypothetical protein